MTLGSDKFGNNVQPPQISVGRIASGLFLLVLAVYVLSSPGRIDIIDGQARFNVAYNWLHSGQPLLTDSWIKPWMAVRGRHNLPYSYYGAPASVLPMPLMAVGSLYDDGGLGTSQFLFSLTSSILGAGIATVLFLFYVELELSVGRATVWTLISAFATLVWPASTSTFDNAQHAFFALTSLYISYLSARRSSHGLAAIAGIVGGVLLLYQPYFCMILPPLALATVNLPVVEKQSHQQLHGANWKDRVVGPFQTLFKFIKTAFQYPGQNRDSCIRVFCFLSAISADVLLFCLYNKERFGAFFDDGKLHSSLYRAYPLWGHPLAGFLSLLVSPGKSAFLYSPLLIVGLLGWRRLCHRSRELAIGIIAATAILILFISCISFAGGDWCWGPRYLVVLLPLWALAFPFAGFDSKTQRISISALVCIGLAVQMLALSVDHQRFFLERGFRDYFWAEDRWCYFKHSALFARVHETISLSSPIPPEAVQFNTVPVPDWHTYTILGPNPRMPRSLAPQWMRQFKVFYLPRPWPFWMTQIKAEERPIKLTPWLASLGCLAMMGLILMRPIFRKTELPAIQESFAEEEALV